MQVVGFGIEYLQDRIDREIVLARPMGVIVESADEAGLVLSAPLPANVNHKGTAFGGSLYCLAVLTGWAWLTRYIASAAINADAVIQESNMQYLVPVCSDLRAAIVPPVEADIDKFRRALKRAGRGRIALRVEMHQGGQLATVFEGLFAAAMRRPEI